MKTKRITSAIFAFLLALTVVALPSVGLADEGTDVVDDDENVVAQTVEGQEATATQDEAEDAAESEVPTLSPDVTNDDGKQLEVAEPETDVEEQNVEPEATSPALSGRAHVQDIGWQSATLKNGVLTLGTTGRALRLEAVQLSVSGGSISYKSHVQDVGWESSWASQGASTGTTGKARRLEAIRIRLSDDLAQSWTVQYRVHVQDFGWLGWTADGSEAGTTGMAKRLESVEVRIVPKGTALPSGGGAAYRDAGLSGRAHVQDIGWMGTRQGYGISLGTTGRGKRLEAVTIGRPGLDCTGNVVYSAHVQNIGWQRNVTNGALAGTTGRGLRIEAMKLSLTGELAQRYDIWARAHVQDIGWMAWAKNATVGTEGMSLRMEAIEVALVAKNGSAPAANGQAIAIPFLSSSSLGTVSYRGLQGGSWTGWQANGATAGNASGVAFKGVAATLSGGPAGSISYAVHVADLGWQSYVAGGAEASKGGKDVQALRMRLSGDVARFASVWYRAYVKDKGWTGWARDGEDCGSVGLGKPMLAMQVQIKAKNATAPGSTSNKLFRTFSSGDAELDSILDNIVRNVTGSDGNALRRAYDYVAGYGYVTQGAPTGGWTSWSPGYAKEMYKNHGGNCYRYASLLCWIARRLGYDASVVRGTVLLTSGRAPHAWVEVREGGNVYILDAERHRNMPQYDFYMKTYDNVVLYYYK